MPHPEKSPAAATAGGRAQSPEIEPIPEFIDRRCWRCLLMFPGDAPAGPSPTVDFWLCDPCAATLLPPRAGHA